jgi:hypothetical protein
MNQRDYDVVGRPECSQALAFALMLMEAGDDSRFYELQREFVKGSNGRLQLRYRYQRNEENPHVFIAVDIVLRKVIDHWRFSESVIGGSSDFEGFFESSSS